MCGIGAATVGSIFFSPIETHSAGRPFCRFSLEDGWSDTGPQEYISRRARNNDPSGVPQVVEQIYDSLAINPQIEIYISQSDDAAFAAVANQRRILVVDVGFLERLNRMADTDWAAVQVIAHEVGHHIAGFNVNRHRSELNADYWSGQVLQRLGSSRAAAQRAILTVGTNYDTPSHPNKRRRAETIARGWNDASFSKIDYSYCDDCQ